MRGILTKEDANQYATQKPYFVDKSTPTETVLGPLFTKSVCGKTFSSVIDLGCGDGWQVEAMVTNKIISNQTKIFLNDLSKTRLERAKQKLPKNYNVTTHLHSSDDLKAINTNSIELAYSSQVIEHVPDDARMCREIFRILTPKGTFYISSIIKSWYGWYFHRCNGKWTLDETHVREYASEEEFTKIILKSGLHILETDTRKVVFPLKDILKRISSRIRLPYSIENSHISYTFRVPGYNLIEAVGIKPESS